MDRNDFERLVDMTLADGKLTEQEQKVLIQRASEIGIGPDELQVILDAKIQEKQNEAQKEQQQAQQQQTMTATIASMAKQGGNGNGGNDGPKVRKCPSCGATVGSFTSKCPECGAELNSGSKPSGISIEKFSEMLTGSRGINERINVISYSAIPATKEELLSFLTFSYSQILSTMQNNDEKIDDRIREREAWKQKINEAVIKGDIVFKNDPQARETVSNIKTEISAKLSVLKRNMMIYWGLKSTLVLIGFIIFCVNFNYTPMLYGIFIMAGTFFVVRKSWFSRILQL